MKLFNEIDADVDGEIVEILVNNGQLRVWTTAISCKSVIRESL